MSNKYHIGRDPSSFGNVYCGDKLIMQNGGAGIADDMVELVEAANRGCGAAEAPAIEQPQELVEQIVVVETLLIYAFLEGYQLGRIRTKPLARGKLIDKAVWLKDRMLRAGARIAPIDEAIRRHKGQVEAPPMLILSLDGTLDEIERNCKAAEREEEQATGQPDERTLSEKIDGLGGRLMEQQGDNQFRKLFWRIAKILKCLPSGMALS